MTKQQKASWGYPVDISYACLKTKMCIGVFKSNNKYISKHNYLRFDSENKII